MTVRHAFSVATFARHGGRILLIKHRRLGLWLPAGGEILPGETPLEAARRELNEETGLDGRFEASLGVAGAPPGLLGYEEHVAGSKGVHLNLSFVAEVDSERVRPNDEVTEWRWVSDPAEVECPANVVELGRMALCAAGSPLVHLARRWIAAFNGRDLEGLLALYADDAVHTSPKLRARHPETNGEIRGKAALRTWWADCFERLPKLRYVERRLTADRDRVFMEYERHHPGEAVLEVAEVLCCKESLIRSSHVFHG